MPYIKKEDREAFWGGAEPETPGELNYAITLMLNDYISYNGASYSSYNEVIGVLECVKLELYRRVISKYEDKKMKENGDVYPT